MPYRRDALQGAARIIARLREAVLQQENALVTVGTIELQHNSINTIPGEVFFTIDMRHPPDEPCRSDGNDLHPL